jgi:hypothetical protein
MNNKALVRLNIIIGNTGCFIDISIMKRGRKPAR